LLLLNKYDNIASLLADSNSLKIFSLCKSKVGVEKSLAAQQIVYFLAMLPWYCWEMCKVKLWRDIRELTTSVTGND